MDLPSNTSNKKELRTEMKKLRDQLPPDQRRQLEENITHKLVELVEKRKPRKIHSYLPMGSEVNIYPFIEKILQSGVTIVTPRSLPGRKMQHLVLHSTNALEDGIFGTRHPAEGKLFSGKYDIILVPGLAFDHSGNRLGYGAGYYDTFLQEHMSAYKVGIGFPFQLMESIPAEEHDVRLDAVIC